LPLLGCLLRLLRGGLDGPGWLLRLGLTRHRGRRVLANHEKRHQPAHCKQRGFFHLVKLLRCCGSFHETDVMIMWLFLRLLSFSAEAKKCFAISF
jgi:hypothetical protein